MPNNKSSFKPGDIVTYHYYYNDRKLKNRTGKLAERKSGKECVYLFLIEKVGLSTSDSYPPVWRAYYLAGDKGYFQKDIVNKKDNNIVLKFEDVLEHCTKEEKKYSGD
tara:strand:- start:1596 stop:1919 length:324 start_codon:yes stop_codon:yes gene_type:complete